MYNQIWRFFWPALLVNSAVPLLNFTDIWAIGHLDNSLFLGALALGGNAIMLLFTSFNFLRMSTVGLSARVFGERDYAKLVQILVSSLLIAFFLALAVLFFWQQFVDIVIYVYSPVPEVDRLLRDYLQVRQYSSPAVLLTFVFLGWLIAIQNTTAPLFVVCVAIFANIALDIYLVRFCGMGVTGVAVGTVIADYLGLLMATALTFRSVQGFKLIGYRVWQIPQYLVRSLCKSGGELFTRTICLMIVFLLFTKGGALQDTSTIAANAILMSMVMFVSGTLDGVAYASEALTGEAAGRGDVQSLRTVIIHTGICSLFFSCVFIVFFMISGRQIIDWMTNIAEIKEIASDYLSWVVVLPLLVGASYWLDGVFVGLGETSEMRNVMLFSTVAVFFPIWILVFVFKNNHILWLSFAAFMTARSSGMIWILVALIRGKFRKLFTA